MTSFAHDSKQLAEIYDRVSDTQFDGGKRLVERLGLDEAARVLDVGCGTGRLARWIAERVGPKGSVAGIDPLEERVASARSGGSAVSSTPSACRRSSTGCRTSRKRSPRRVASFDRADASA
jgi:ubiquinone/menaquinone biosynthesis C-methylase UbiE